MSSVFAAEHVQLRHAELLRDAAAQRAAAPYRPAAPGAVSWPAGAAPDRTTQPREMS
jgi:hypothetical protein